MPAKVSSTPLPPPLPKLGAGDPSSKMAERVGDGGDLGDENLLMSLPTSPTSAGALREGSEGLVRFDSGELVFKLPARDFRGLERARFLRQT